MILGMTGTRESLSDDQMEWLCKQVSYASDVHHGACVGADESAHDAALHYDAVIVVHPPTDEKLMMDKARWSERACIYVMPAKPYHARNIDIVNASDRMIALPNGPERKGSGTWNTINYAMSVGKRVTICYPDRTIDDRIPVLS
jgi:hypothetical protein